MAEIVQNIIQNSVGGMVAGAVTTIGSYAGDAVGGIGNMIESAGRSVGEGGINRSISGVGSSINSYGDSVRRATSASAPSYGSAAPRTAVTKSANQAKEQKKQPPRKEPQKTLPSTKPMKALPAPPRMARSKSADTVTSKASTTISRAAIVKPKPFDPTYSTYKPTGSSYAAPGGAAANQRKPQPNKKLTGDGKVRISAASRPSKPPAPKPVTTSSQAPRGRLTETNLKSVSGSGAVHIPGYAPSAAGGASVKAGSTLKAPGGPPKDKARSAAPSKAGSVAGTIDRQFF